MRDYGVHAVRQHKIGRYTVDFAIRRARIVIEIDGAVHDFPGRPEYDAERQAYIENKGWKVIRVRTEATRDPKAVVDAIRAVLPLPLRGGGRGRGEAPPSPGSHNDNAQTPDVSASPRPPTPSPQGEGAFAPHLRRRTRANRKLPPRRKS
jgi:hypothetical protein